MNPGNSAPGVVWLASDESLHVTGQVLRLVGNNLARLPAVGDGRAVPRHREGRLRRSSGTRPTSAASSTGTHFSSENPGIDAQRRERDAPSMASPEFETIAYEEATTASRPSR